LLDRAELRRGLGADDREQLLGGLRIELLRDDRLGLAGALATLELVGHVLLDPGAKAERVVLREVRVPLLRKAGEVREVVPLPVHDGFVGLTAQMVIADSYA